MIDTTWLQRTIIDLQNNQDILVDAVQAIEDLVKEIDILNEDKRILQNEIDDLREEIKNVG